MNPLETTKLEFFSYIGQGLLCLLISVIILIVLVSITVRVSDLNWAFTYVYLIKKYY